MDGADMMTVNLLRQARLRHGENALLQTLSPFRNGVGDTVPDSIPEDEASGFLALAHDAAIHAEGIEGHVHIPPGE